MTYDFIVGVPFTGCKRESLVPCAREDDALGLAFGAYLAGKKPLVFMQNNGFFTCLDLILSVLKPAGVNIDMEIEDRSKGEQHELVSQLFRRLFRGK